MASEKQVEWTDERIALAAFATVNKMGSNIDRLDTAKLLFCQMRDDYGRTIAELRAQLDDWQTVPSGEYPSDGDSKITILDRPDGDIDIAIEWGGERLWSKLPQGWRLQQKIERGTNELDG